MAGTSELERLVSDTKKDKKLVSHFALLGHDTGSFVKVANNLGYHFTDADVNAYVAKKTASVTKNASQPVASLTVSVAVSPVASLAVALAVTNGLTIATTVIDGTVEVAVVITTGLVVLT